MASKTEALIFASVLVKFGQFCPLRVFLHQAKPGAKAKKIREQAKKS